MNLSYRGIAYSLTSPAADVIETDKTGYFRGAFYKIVEREVTHQQRPAQLRYRGITYMN